MAMRQTLISWGEHIGKAYDRIELLGGTSPEYKNIENLSPTIEGMVARPSEIKLQFLASGTATIRNLWTTSILVDGVAVATNSTTNVAVTNGKEVTVKEAEMGAFRAWTSSGSPFVSGVQAKIISMPKMKYFTTDKDGTTAGDFFFYGFNSDGTITEYPAGSFDTSGITTFGEKCFRYFNRRNTVLSSLPIGSFNFDSMQSALGYFCQNFNREATKLTQLPVGSFNFPNLVSVGGNMFASFNLTGSLTSLPKGSFRFPKLKTVGGGFGYFYNGVNGKISALPYGSFDMSAVTATVGTMFEDFNGASGGIGMLARDYTNYTNTKNMTSSNVVAYYHGGGSETVTPGALFHWKMETA